VSQEVNHDSGLGRRVATVAVAVAGLGLLVALAGLGITLDECEAACGTAAEQAFRESMGGIACLAAFVEGLSHLS
jgi:hypothetical protein